jgi:D-hydroxyproline dehydrogenase subunit gamma
MMATRISNNVTRSNKITILVNGQSVQAYAGETIATVLFAEGISTFYKTKNNQPRGPFCNMGICFECRVKVEVSNGPATWVRACMTPVTEQMSITCGAEIHVHDTKKHTD